MTDIAKIVGVSQSTVSLVLNQVRGAKLSQETRDRVHQVAQQLGYQMTRRAAAPAVSAHRNVIACLCDELSASPHASLCIDGARDGAWEHSCLLSIYVTRGNAEHENAILQALAKDPNVLGVIYARSYTQSVEPPPALLARTPGTLPCVLLNCYDAERRLSSVIPSGVTGGFAATEHLIGLGHSRIGFINGESWMDTARERAKGYRQALATADLPLDAKLMREGDWMIGSGYTQAQALLELERPPTAILCANDLMAIGAMQAAQRLGLRVPEDISIQGFDNLDIARHTVPTLSTVLQPDHAMGQWAAERLIEEAAQEPHERMRRQVKMDCPLVPRESVGAPTVVSA